MTVLLTDLIIRVSKWLYERAYRRVYWELHRLAPVLKTIFHQCHILVASLTLMALEPSELDCLQVYDMTH